LFGGKQEEATPGICQSAGPAGETTPGLPDDQPMSTPDQPTETGENPGDDA
jgi:hypothetical protein